MKLSVIMKRMRKLFIYSSEKIAKLYNETPKAVSEQSIMLVSVD